VFKTSVYALCAFVNARTGRDVIPHSTMTKAPSAELRPDQRDDQSLPPYEVLDPILELYVEQDLTIAEIVAMGHDAALVTRIARLVDINEYKRRQGPPGVRVSTKAFGKDRRLPMTNGYRG
jgi:NAD+ synthase (glutamine-hydrolysing)